MKFRRAPTEPNFDRLKLVSEGGEWELGLWSVMFGVRLRFGLNAVHIILQEVPETVTESELHRMFPDYTLKPINNCPYCWPRLQQMRDEARARLAIEEWLPFEEAA
jgi:hypothetical protein